MLICPLLSRDHAFSVRVFQTWKESFEDAFRMFGLFQWNIATFDFKSFSSFSDYGEQAERFMNTCVIFTTNQYFITAASNDFSWPHLPPHSLSMFDFARKPLKYWELEIFFQQKYRSRIWVKYSWHSPGKDAM